MEQGCVWKSTDGSFLAFIKSYRKQQLTLKFHDIAVYVSQTASRECIYNSTSGFPPFIKKKKKKKATVIFPHLDGNDSRLWGGFNDSPFNNVKSSLPANELLAALFAQGGEIKTLLGPFTVKDMKHLAAVHTSCQANVMTQRDVLHNE